MKASDLALVTKVLPALLVVLAITGICGYLARKVHQPRVVGEIVGGILLGPSALGLIFPDFQHWLFPSQATQFFVVLANIGLALYMFVVGMEIDHHGSFRTQLKSAGGIAAAGIIPTFGLGLALGFIFHGRLAPPGISAAAFAVFLGCALSVTALPVLARILDEQGITGTRLGSVLLTASAAGDVVAWCLLTFALALGKTKEVSGSPWIAISGALGIVVVAVGIVRPLLKSLAKRVADRSVLSHGELSFIIVLVLLIGCAADAVGVFAAFGGFVLGLVAPRKTRLAEQVQLRVGSINSVLVLPILFASAGMNTYLWGLRSPALVVPLVLVVAAACIGKYGCVPAAKVSGFSWQESLAAGALMNSRGVMELVIAGAGLAYGLISTEAYSMLVFMTLVTTAAALPLSRRLLNLDSKQPRLEGAFTVATGKGI